MAAVKWAHNNGGRNGLVRDQRGCVWYQRGEATSHCPKCHVTFTSLQGFDAHQSIVNGRVECMGFPALKVNRDGNLAFEYVPPKYPDHETVKGYWRLVTHRVSGDDR